MCESLKAEARPKCCEIYCLHTKFELGATCALYHPFSLLSGQNNGNNRSNPNLDSNPSDLTQSEAVVNISGTISLQMLRNAKLGAPRDAGLRMA